MASSQTLKLGLVLLIVIGVAVSAMVVAMSVRAEPPTAPTIPTWPSFTMLYETNGITYSRGGSPAVTTREVHRLDYQSATQWIDTVVEVPTIETPVGSDSRVGYYTQLNGNSYTEYNAAGESTFSDTVEEDTTLLVGTMPPPFPIKESGITTTATTTSSKVCFQEECTENTAGVLYTKDSGSEFVFVDDARGIPLRVNDTFIVREITIDDTKEEIVR